DELRARPGVQVVEERYVQDGNVITSAGVSAGIDMALHLVSLVSGEETARAVQKGIEYYPEPPFGRETPTAAGREAR
ncbi:MAG: DJ-1/PfpI family protein, partial [Dehalococcoidia bacterium]|nr:DJ-1/PfpI family protein [Dehalococcoidia bacterium]